MSTELTEESSSNIKDIDDNEAGASVTNSVQPPEKNDGENAQIKRFPPTPPVPPGMTKSAWKRQLRREKWEAKKGELTIKRRERKKELRAEKRKLREEQEAAGIEVDQPRKKGPLVQEKVPLDVIIDCGFDDLMTDKERTSLTNQVTRCYSSNKRNKKKVNLRITSFNSLLLEKFEGPMKNQHKLWKDVSIESGDYVPDPEKFVYLTSDSTNVVDTLEEGKTYIVGGIVDKGRYKNLCKEKADKQNIPTARLPIDEYVKISGRRVLTTNHVFEILLRYLEFDDWKQAFESVLPQRKRLEGGDDDDEEESASPVIN